MLFILETLSTLLTWLGITFLASVSFSGSLSTSNSIPTDTSLLDNFCVCPSFRRFKDIVPVVWKAPTVNWIKVNIDGWVKNTMAACRGIFRDHHSYFLGCFACNLGAISLFEAELTGLIIAMEYAVRFQWHRLVGQYAQSGSALEGVNSAFEKLFGVLKKNMILIKLTIWKYT